jgi:hypothetical protein
MPLAVHHSSELVTTILTILALAVFVVVALTWIPDWVSPRVGGEMGGSTGAVSRMIK